MHRGRLPARSVQVQVQPTFQVQSHRPLAERGVRSMHAGRCCSPPGSGLGLGLQDRCTCPLKQAPPQHPMDRGAPIREGLGAEEQAAGPREEGGGPCPEVQPSAGGGVLVE